MVYLLWFFVFELIAVVGAYYRSTIVGYTIVSVSDANVQLTQYDASLWCRSNGTQLLEIPNGDTQEAVAQFLKDAFKNGLINGWSTLTNAKRDGRGWQWVNGPSIGGGIIIEKQGPDLSTSFGFLQNTGTRVLIAASLPSDRRSYICEGPSYCSGGETFNGRCYRSHVDSVDWFDARNRCLDGGGDLASFDFIVDSQGLSALNRTWMSSAYTYWIGIRRIFWKWQSTNFEAKYTQWDNEQPAYNPTFECVCLTPYEWNWSPCDCSQRFQFICLSATNTSSTIGSPSTSTSTTTTSTTSTSTTTTTTTTTKTTTTTAAAAAAAATSTAKSSLAAEKSSTQNTDSNHWTSLASTTAADVDSNPQQSLSDSHPTYEQALGIGLGVGIAGGLIISAIIVCCYVRARRRGWPGTFEKVPEYSATNHQRPPETSSYALIQRKSSSQWSRQSSTADHALNIIYAYPQLQLQQPNSHYDSNEAPAGLPDQAQKKRRLESLNTNATNAVHV